MISFNFNTLHIWIGNIKKGVDVYTSTLEFQFNFELSNIRRMCSFFQDVGEINGTQVPFTIGIQTPTQCESMLSYGHNGAIFMDVTFDTNDMKFQLFTLMGIDDHHTCVPLVWIITSK
jgi:hypothetical protein